MDPTGLIPPQLAAAGVGAAVGAAIGAASAIFNHGDILTGALSGMAVGATAGLTLGTSLIGNSLIGATISASADYASQRYSNPCKDIDGLSIAINGLAGAIGSGTGTAMLKGGKMAAKAVDAALMSGALSGGTALGLHNAASSGPNMVPYK